MTFAMEAWRACRLEILGIMERVRRVSQHNHDLFSSSFGYPETILAMETFPSQSLSRIFKQHSEGGRAHP
jgi:hypothetical protein